MKNNHKNIKIFLRKLSYSNKYFFLNAQIHLGKIFLFKHIFIRWKVFFCCCLLKKAIKAVKRKKLEIFLRILCIYIVINTFINSRKISMHHCSRIEEISYAFFSLVPGTNISVKKKLFKKCVYCSTVDPIGFKIVCASPESRFSTTRPV